MLLEWIQEHRVWITVLAAASVVIFVVSLVTVPMLIAHIPADYFAHDTRPASIFANCHPALRMFIRIGKNLLGAVLLAGGIAMLALPGQGLLTMLAGFILIEIPGKYRLEKWIVSRHWIYRSINWLRSRAGRNSLILESHSPPPR